MIPKSASRRSAFATSSSATDIYTPPKSSTARVRVGPAEQSELGAASQARPPPSGASADFEPRRRGRAPRPGPRSVLERQGDTAPVAGRQIGGDQELERAEPLATVGLGLGLAPQ